MLASVMGDVPTAERQKTCVVLERVQGYRGGKVPLDGWRTLPLACGSAWDLF